MLFSGELSITTSELALVPELAVEPPVAVLDVPVDELDEQAARPAARRPVAVSASTLLLRVLLVVNFDLSSRLLRMKGGALPG
jgi:hypothetical protein